MSLVKEAPSFEPSGEDTEARNGWPIGWLTFLAIGWVLYELTAQPAAGVTAVCLKFGWEDFRTAFWLRRTDPLYKRGKACFWLYLAAGLWKTALVALAMIIPYSILFGQRAGGPNQVQNLEHALMAASATMTGSFALSGLSTTFACWDAYWGGFPLWLSRGVHRARRRNVWPPSLCVPEESNRLGALLFTTALLVAVPAFILGALLIIPFIGKPIRHEVALILILSLAAIPLGALMIRDFVVRKLMAPDPFVCWDSNEHSLGEPNEPWQDSSPSAKVE